MSDDVRVYIFVESRYKVSRRRIRNAIIATLKKHAISSLVEVSVAFVGDRKMHFLNKTYRGKDSTTNILSFSLTEGNPVLYPPKVKALEEGILRLGDIVISYPQIIKEAVAEEMLVDDKIDELVIHGLSHLLGIHH